MEQKVDCMAPGSEVNRLTGNCELPLEAQPAVTTPMARRNLMQSGEPQPGASTTAPARTAPGQEHRHDGTAPSSQTSTRGNGERKPPAAEIGLADSPQNGARPASDPGGGSEGSSSEPKKPIVDAQEIIRAYEAKRRGSDARRQILALEDTIRTALTAGVPLGPMHSLLHERKLIAIKKTRFVDLCTELFDLPR